MSWVAIAIGGSALVGAGASIFASNKQTKAANQSIQVQQGAQEYQKSVDARNQANIAPYLQAGQRGLSKVNDVMSGAPGWDNFLRSPDYNFRFGEGVRAGENSAAARGGLLSGNFLRGITDYGQKSASQEFGNYFGRIMDVARLGQNSAVGAGSLGVQSAGQVGQTAGQIGSAITGAGAASASGAVGASNALTGGVQNYLFYNALQNRPSAYQPTNISPVFSGSTPIAPYLGNPGGTGGLY